MNKTLLSIAMLTFSFAASAQYVRYPSSLAALYSSADASVPARSTGRPLIGVTDISVMESVTAAGGAPVLVCPVWDDFNLYRDMAASLDGFVLSPDFTSRSSDEVASGSMHAPAALLLKALVDRNVPMMGNFPLLDSLNIGLMRLNDNPLTTDALVARAGLYREAKAVMQRCLTLDTHSDLPGRYKRGYSVGRRSRGQISVQRMQEGGLDAEVLIAFAGGGPLTPEGYAKIFGSCSRMLQRTIDDISAYPDACGIARSPKEAYMLRDQGKKVFFLGVENAYGLGHDLANLQWYWDRGVRYMTLCHMYDNDVCNTSNRRSADSSKGLTEFGREVVAEMNRLGMLVDLSHTSEGTFWDVMACSKAPVICSHSGADAVFHHDRNLTDRQLRALAANGGVIQVYLVDDYQNADPRRICFDDFHAHLLHCIEVAGIDHVGIGSDFDGGGGGWGLNGANDMVNITMALLSDGFSEADIRKLWGENFLRVMSEAQALASGQNM